MKARVPAVRVKRSVGLSRRGQDKLRQEIKASRVDMARSEDGRRELLRQVAQAQQVIDQRGIEQQRLEDHILVLQSDRDRITAALEVCVRRLASPHAEANIARGGWRGANRLLSNAVNEQPDKELRRDEARG